MNRESRAYHFPCFRTPLCSYIKWTQETFTAGGHKAELIPILERCTRELQNIPAYQNDIRYLRVWIQYADCLPDPSDVFSFLKQRQIGQNHALFYIAHATFLELCGSYADADKAYQEGIDRKAAPVERLRTKFLEFQHRMARRIQRKAMEDRPLEEDESVRKSLSVMGGTSSRGAGLSSQKRRAVDPLKNSNRNSEDKELQIFVDEEFGGSSVPVCDKRGESKLPTGSMSEIGHPWTQLPSYNQATKENTQQSNIWAGQRMKQKQSLSTGPGPTLHIPLDPEFAEQELHEKQREASYVNATNGTLRQRLEGARIGEQLSQDPLRLHRTSTAVESHIDGRSKAHACRPRQQVLAISNISLLEEEGSKEVNFEEIRAKYWKEKFSVELNVDSVPSPMEIGGENETQDAQPPASMVSPSKHTELLDRSLSDITLTTRGAFEAANALFSRSFSLSSSIAEKNPLVDQKIATETHAALQNVNGMIAAPESYLQINDANEPTVTINTRSAFEALKAAFSGGANEEDRGPDRFSSPTLLVRKDSSFLSDANSSFEHTQKELSTSLDIREDTIFIKNSNNSAQNQLCLGDEDETLNIREDTIFIKGGNGEVSDNGGGKDETVIMSRCHPLQALAPSSDASFDIREDTVFIRKSTDPSSSGLDDETEPLHQYLRYERPLLVGENPNVPTARLRDSATENVEILPYTTAQDGRTDGLSGNIGPIENDENLAPNAEGQREGAETNIRHRHGGVLHALDNSELEERGIQVITQEDSEYLLGMESESAAEGDSFQCCGSVVPSYLIDPFSDDFQDQMLAHLDPPVESWPSVFCISASEEVSVMDLLKRKDGSTNISVNIGQHGWSLLGRIGEGSYATVYLVVPMCKAFEQREYAIKLESPGRLWEFYLLRAVAHRVAAPDRLHFAEASALYFGPKASLLVTAYERNGTLQDLINLYASKGQKMSEEVALFLSSKVLRQVGVLHNTAHVLHNDIKPDNFLVKVESHHGEQSIPSLTLQLIDFGRGIDLELLPNDVAFIGDSATDSFRSVEMREGKPWMWQADAYGVAAVIHCLLFGEYMDVERVVPLGEGAETSYVRIKNQLKRYWQIEIWESVFHTLLNWNALNRTSPPPCIEMAETIERVLHSNITETEIRKLLTMVQPRP